MTGELKGVYFSPWWKNRRLIFRFREHGRWERFEAFRPWEVREALKVALERIEESVPGALSKAAELDDQEFQSNARRKRRYIAENKDLLYLNSPHLTERSSEPVKDHWVVTNIAWRDVPSIIRLVCEAAGVTYEPLGNLRF